MTGMPATARAWPEPYLQPDRTKDCGYYAQAYLARCLGHPEVTADQVKAWRAETSIHETMYARDVLGADMRRFWDESDALGRDDVTEKRQRWYWLGPGLASWVMGWIFTGWIAQVMLHRIQPLGHAAVLLEASPDGVLLMDPIYGHIREPWGWFLGPGPKAGREDWPGAAPDGRQFHGCTFIEGWYKRAGAVVTA